jgi:solute carrier family 13 (sodium-dependent dicarboxylate transporter), member 2/3/5
MLQAVRVSFGQKHTAAAVLQALCAQLPKGSVFSLLLGPIAGLVLWWLPLGLDPVAHRAIAIVGLMLVYWMTEALDHGLTALVGCLLFWLLHVAPPAVAFSGFATPTPWFMLGGLLIGQAVRETGLAKRLGYYAVHAAQGSPTRVLLGFTILVCVLSLLLSSSAQVATLAPVAMGVVAALGLSPHSNTAKGLFLVLSYVSSTCGKMILSGGVVVLAWGIMEKQAGVHVLWSQWFLAFLPLTIPTILASWLTMRWLYPPETTQPSDCASWHDTVRSLGSWSRDERKVLGWLLLAITLWATDFLHHGSPAAIGITIGLILTVPGLGVLDMKAVKAVNFLLIIFTGGVVSMANVLTETHALTSLAALVGTWHDVLLSNAWRATLALYWGGFLYHFLVGSEFTMVSTMLPVLLHVAATHGYNLVAMGMLWVFAGSGKLFVYQNTGLILGYSYGFFQAKDVLKVGAVLTVVEGLLILALVTLYWPLIGLSWRPTPSAQVQVISSDAADISETGAPAWQHTAPGVQQSMHNTQGLQVAHIVSSVWDALSLARSENVLVSAASELSLSPRRISSLTWALSTSSRSSMPAAADPQPHSW